MPYGLDPGYDRLYARNRTPQTVAGYTGSPGESPSPAGIYANSGMAGRMSDYGAQQNYAQTGYMPNRTVGGAYGLRGYPSNRLSQGQVLQQASGNQYGLMGAAADSNLGGRLWGGAMPDYVAGRPAWTTGPREGRAMSPDQNAQYSAAHGLYFDAKTGAMGGNAGLQSGLDPQQNAMAGLGISPFAKRLTPAQAAQARAGGAPGPNQIAAQAREGQRGGILNRVAIRQQNAERAQQSALAAQQNQMMMGLAMHNPAMAMQLAQLNSTNQYRQAQIGLQGQQLTQQGTIAQRNSQDRRYGIDQGLLTQQYQGWNARYQQAIKDGHSPADAMSLAGPPPTAPGQGIAPQGGLTGPAQQSAAVPRAPAGQAGYKPKKPLLEAQVGQIAGAPLSRREAMLRAFGVTDPGDIYHYQSQIDPRYNAPTLYDKIGNSPAVSTIGDGLLNGFGVPGLNSPYINPAAAGGLLGGPAFGFGYQAPPPVRAGRFRR